MQADFIPCYRITFKFLNYDSIPFRKEVFYVDYFLKDSHGVSMYELIVDKRCIPYKKTIIEFERLS